ncbi:MAG TPA: glycosyltransferase family 39 protein [Solirubrobacterales bacterium]|nr:glycosyltransferase family 39 protein [Solirubrobacterales bacterium]
MEKPPWLAPALLVGIALLIRVAAIGGDLDYVPAHDAFDYDRHARSIAAGEGFPESGYAPEGGPTALRPPVYPYFLGAVYAVFGDSVDAGRLAGALLGAASVWLLFLVVLRIWGRRVALVAAAAAAVFPPLVLLSRELLSEQLFIALELGAVLCVLEARASSRPLRWAAAAGALCGIATLTRNPGGVLILPVLIGLWRPQPGAAARGLAAPAVGLLCILLVMTPWTLRNWSEFGRFVPVTSSTGFGLAGTYNDVSMDDADHPAAWRTPVIVPEYEPLFQAPQVDEGTLDATLRREAVQFAWDHPGYAIEVSGRNLLRLFAVSGDSVVGRDSELVVQRGIGSDRLPAERLSLALALVLGAAGALFIWRRRLPRGPLFLWLVPALTVLVALPVAGLPRYRAPADPFILILGAIGISCLWDETRKRWAAGS